MNAFILSAAIALAAVTPPVELPIYRTTEKDRTVLLVPVDSYRMLANPPVVPRAKAPPAPPPGPDRIRRVRITGAVTDHRAHLTLVAELDLGSAAARSIPLLPSATGLTITRFRGPGELVSTPNRGPFARSLATTTAGAATVELGLVVAVQKVEQGYRLALPLPGAPEQILELDLPDRDVVVRSPRGLLLSSAPGPAGTHVRAAGGSAGELVLTWVPTAQARVLPEVGAPEPEAQPELSVNVATLAIAGESHVKMRSTVAVTVKRAPIQELVLAAPANASIVDISGREVAEWESAAANGLQVARVNLRAAVQDKIELAVEYEVPVTDNRTNPKDHGDRLQVSFVPVHVPAAYQEEHSLGIACPPNLDLEAATDVTWRELDPARVPASLAALAGQTLARLYHCERFPRAGRTGAPAAFELQCRRLDEVKLLQATVDLMEATTALTEDGHRITRVTFHVRNNSQQFLSLRPPEGSRPLTVYVAGKAVRAASDAAGQWLVPLGKSGRTANGAAPFEVSVTYLQEQPTALVAGRPLALELPRADLGISTVRWTVALPKEWTLATNGGNVRSETAYRPVVFASGETGGNSAPSALFDEATLPLAIELPRMPEAYHFSQDLLDKDADARRIVVVLSRSTHELTRRALAFLVGVLFFYVVLRRRPEGRARVIATIAALLGTGLLMALFGWASSTLGLTLHLALGLFMGTVVFGVTRLAVGVAHPAVWSGARDDDE